MSINRLTENIRVQLQTTLLTYRITYRIGPPQGTDSEWLGPEGHATHADLKNPVDDPSLFIMQS